MEQSNPGDCANSPGAVDNLSEQVDMTQTTRACLGCGADISHRSPGHVWENVAAAHSTCNSSKRNRVRSEDWVLHEELKLRRADEKRQATGTAA